MRGARASARAPGTGPARAAAGRAGVGLPGRRFVVDLAKSAHLAYVKAIDSCRFGLLSPPLAIERRTQLPPLIEV
jgi:hypothetical protein